MSSEASGKQDKLMNPSDSAPKKVAFPIVGVGASAGGLEAFGEFVEALDPDCGIAVVFILHLPPDHKSALVEILSKRTKMAVKQVEDGMLVEVNHVYVIKPGHTLTLDQGLFRLGNPVEKPGHGRPVDDFFKSLAQQQQDHAICILLSGMGSNGTAGAKCVKAMGGLCIAQDPDSAKFNSMPRHLIDAGQADYILQPADIPAVLDDYIKHFLPGNGPPKVVDDKQSHQHLLDVFAILRTRIKQDFSGYKKATVLRRVDRRMNLNRATKLADYVQILRQNPTEVTALAEDLLIHVTGFFRDARAWENLRNLVIVPLIANRESGSAIRCWVTACSSGEEAYSLAMMLIEETEHANKMLDIKVFATDMADRSLNQARAGLYPGGIEAEISKERLERFFQKEDEMYRVTTELRERVVFASQNVLQDPPFSRLDIITCRNLLIYLEPKIQQRVLMLLHFGLRDDGILFLGTSEAVTGAEEHFESVDKQHRIFRRIGSTRHGMTQLPTPQSSVEHTQAPQATLTPSATQPRLSLAQLTHKTLLALHVPAAVTVDRDYRIIYFQGNTDPFLNQPRGEATRNLLSLAKESLRSTIRTVLQRAAMDHQPHSLINGLVESQNGQHHRVAITASVLDTRMAPDYFVISFEDRGEVVTSQPAQENTDGPTLDNENLQEELRHVRQELQMTIEELQTSNEEMKASNEEVMSMNEELQSTNEELETSKEEMQSLNEELTTVNAQLQAKMDELQETSNDLTSLLSSTAIAVLFLDTHLKIRRFTPAVTRLLELISSDLGRPLSDLARKFSDPHLNEDAKAVLERLVTIDREVQDSKGRWYLRRILPYRTMENRINGVVIVFIDVTERKLTDQALRESKEMLRNELEAMEHLHVVTTKLFSISKLKPALSEVLNATIQAFNADMGKIQILNEKTGKFEVMASRGFSQDVFDKYTQITDSGIEEYSQDLKAGKRIIIEDVHKDKRFAPYREIAHAAGYCATQSSPLLDHNGQLVGIMSICFHKAHLPEPRELRIGDIFAKQVSALLDRLKAEDAAKEYEARFKIVADMVPDLLWQCDVQGSAVWFNNRWTSYTGNSLTQLLGHGWHNIIHHDDRELLLKAFDEAREKNEALRYEVRIQNGEDDYHWFLMQAMPFRNDQGKIVYWYGAATNIHEDRLALNTLRDSELSQRLTLSDMPDYAVFMLDTKGHITTWNPGAHRLLGYEPKKIIGKHISELRPPDKRQTEKIIKKLDKATQTG